jgi:hypothetical protein
MGSWLNQVGAFLHEASENRWLVVIVIAALVGVMAAVRGKLTDSWVVIPLLAGAAWYAFYYYIRVRVGQ